VKKKILIVGIDSFIAKKFEKRARSLGYIIYGTSRKKVKKRVHLDLTWNVKKWPNLNYSFDCIVICASENKVRKCEMQKLKTYKINVLGVKKIIQKYKSIKTQVIFISSSHVFDGKKSIVNFNTIPNPQNQLGMQKFEAEKIILQNQGLVVRVTKIYESTITLFKNWVNDILSRKKVKVFSNLKTSLVPVDTLIEVLIFSIKKNYRGIFHISGPEDKSYYDILKIILKKMKMKSNLVVPQIGSKKIIGRKYSNTVMKISKHLKNKKLYLPNINQIISKNINNYKN
jgi:dTDP-4-dehydrorhamnose reductase